MCANQVGSNEAQAYPTDRVVIGDSPKLGDVIEGRIKHAEREIESLRKLKSELTGGVLDTDIGLLHRLRRANLL